MCFITHLTTYIATNNFFPTLARCPILLDPTNGFVNVTGNSHGDTAIYTCEDGFSLVGSQTQICGVDGIWSGSAPTCQIFVGIKT